MIISLHNIIKSIMPLSKELLSLLSDALNLSLHFKKHTRLWCRQESTANRLMSILCIIFVLSAVFLPPMEKCSELGRNDKNIALY